MKKQLVATNPMLLLLDLQEHIQDGWEIDVDDPINTVFNLTTIGVVKRQQDKAAIESVFPPANTQEQKKPAEVKKSVGRPPNRKD